MKTLPQKLSPKEYVLFRDFVRQKCGLYFPNRKRAELEAKVYGAFAKTDLNTVGEFYRLLADGSEDSPQVEGFINSLTIGETHFFRNSAQFDILKECVLPELIAKKRGSTRQLRIWSAGCATGEEPYSLAILLKELLYDIEDWDILIMATDINQDYLLRAKAGEYTEWSFRNAPQDIKRRYFSHRRKKYTIFNDIKRMITFANLNLIQDKYPNLASNIFAMDLILCRNVTIYFHQDQVKQVVNRFYRTLLNNGCLIVGHSEPTMLTYKCFQSLNFPGTVVYKKVEQGFTPLSTGFDISPESAETVSDISAMPLECFSATSSASLKNVLSEKLEPKPRPSTDKKDPYKDGMRLFNKGMYEQSLYKFKKKIKQDPDFMAAHHMIIKIHANQGRLDEAIKYCREALKIDKLTPRIYYLLALILMQKDQYVEAKQMLKKLLYLDHGFIMGYFTLAQIHRKYGEEHLARRCLLNSRNILEGIPQDELIPESEGETAKSLLQTLEEMKLLDQASLD